MKPFYLLPSLLLILISCKNGRDEKFKNDIIGEWKFVEDFDSITNTYPIPPPSPYRIMLDFAVCNDTLYIDKGGLSWVDESGGYDKRKFHYSGNKTKYKIKDDSLMVFIPHFKVWSSQKIFSIKDDTLVVETAPKKYRKFIRQHYKINTAEKYDAIIVSSSSCYGSCPIADALIERNGKVTYHGSHNNLIDGNYTGKITTAEYLDLEREFKKAGIDTLRTDYAATHTDDQTITVTFIREGKIYKTISDYGFQSPSELISASNQTRFLYQQLKLEKVKLPFPDLRKGYIGFDDKDRSCYLKLSEQFFLITEIEKSRVVNHSFEGVYTLQYGDYGNKKFINTDGRYYKFPLEYGGKTIDLGYNFIERNGLEKRFEKHE